RCEYCRAPQQVAGYRFHVEHVAPVAQGGSDAPANRALACAACNLAKADRVAAVDPQTGTSVALFNPRAQVWSEHFRWQRGGRLVGRTPEGRATLRALDMNGELRLEARQLWLRTGWLP